MSEHLKELLATCESNYAKVAQERDEAERQRRQESERADVWCVQHHTAIRERDEAQAACKEMAEWLDATEWYSAEVRLDLWRERYPWLND